MHTYQKTQCQGIRCIFCREGFCLKEYEEDLIRRNNQFRLNNMKKFLLRNSDLGKSREESVSFVIRRYLPLTEGFFVLAMDQLNKYFDELNDNLDY